MVKNLIDEIKASLKEDRSDPTRKYWANEIISKNISILELKSILKEEHPIGIRFSWVLGDILEQDPSRILPAIPYFFSRRNDFSFPGFDRSLAKMMWKAGIPDEIEGEVVDQLFDWLQDSKIKVAVKVYAISALFDLTLKYPELQEELKLVIEEQMEHCSVAFKTRANRILKKMKKHKG